MGVEVHFQENEKLCKLLWPEEWRSAGRTEEILEDIILVSNIRVELCWCLEGVVFLHIVIDLELIGSIHQLELDPETYSWQGELRDQIVFSSFISFLFCQLVMYCFPSLFLMCLASHWDCYLVKYKILTIQWPGLKIFEDFQWISSLHISKFSWILKVSTIRYDSFNYILIMNLVLFYFIYHWYTIFYLKFIMTKI